MERRWRLLGSLAALVVVLAAMKAAAALLAPIVFGIMVAAISAPGVIWLSRHRVPAVVGALLVLLLDIGVVWLFGGLLYVAAGDVERRLPHYLDQLSSFIASLGHSLTRLPTGRARLASAHADRIGALITDLAERVAGVASDAIVVLFVVFFVLWELGVIGEKFRSYCRNANEQLTRIDRVVRETQKYLLVKVLTSTIAALGVFLVLSVFRVELALFLALLLFVLHFIPNLGAAIATFPAMLVVPDFDRLIPWAEQRGLTDTSRTGLSREPSVRELLEQETLGRLQDLAQYERPKRIAILTEDLTVDSGLLTPTLKVRRRIAEHRFREIIEAMYAGEGEG